jgi:hypothetical protein
LIADAIQERLSQVGLERAVVARLERAEALNDLRQRVLDEIVGIQGAACPAGRRPCAISGDVEIAGAEVVEDVFVASGRGKGSTDASAPVGALSRCAARDTSSAMKEPDPNMRVAALMIPEDPCPFPFFQP